MRATTIAIAVLASVAAGCRFDPTGGVAIDGSEVGGDGAVGDAVTTDGGSPDGAPIVDAAECSNDYPVVRGSHRFGYRTGAMTFPQAKQACEDERSSRTHLATFELGDLDTVLTMLGVAQNDTPWIGATCLDPADCSMRTSWFWVTDVPLLPQSLWEDGQPDNGRTEKVARAERLRGTWRITNVVATLSLPFVCECDP